MDGEEELLGLLSGTLMAMNSIMREKLTPVIREALIGFVAEDKLTEATIAVIEVVMPPMDIDSKDFFGE